MRRVVITGMGIVCPLGNSVSEVYAALLANQSGISTMDSWRNLSALYCHVAGKVEGIEPRKIERKYRRTMGRGALLAAFAAQQAVENAKLDQKSVTSLRTGVAMGSTIGSPAVLEEFFAAYRKQGGFDQISGTTFMKVMSHTVAANTAALLGTRGQMLALCSACTSSTQAIGAGYQAIRYGEQDIMICGGADDLHPTTVGVFDIVHAATRRFNNQPQQTPRPFDTDRDGLVLSEGGGVVVLEEMQHARDRGAPIYGEVLSYATCCNAHHMTQPDAQSMLFCMQSATRNAEIEPTDLGYINAHATATLAGDAAEAQAIRSFVGDAIPVSSIKGYLGHTMAACGAIEAILCLMMIKQGVILPTRNLDKIAPDCEGIKHVQQITHATLDNILTSNFAFGGVSASLVLGKV